MNTRPIIESSEDELPLLTPKQAAFVEALLQGKTVFDAYRLAYDCSTMSNRTASAEASRLKAHPKISAYLRHAQRIGFDRSILTMEEHLAELARARELAIAHGQISAGVQAEHYRGKAAGLYEARLRLESGPSDIELVKAIDDTLGKDLADAIASALGVASGSVKL